MGAATKEVIGKSTSKWKSIAESAEFQELARKRRKFLVPATIFFLIYYFILPVCAGYAKGLMAYKVIGHINFGYLFALSQFVMVWVLAYVYVRKADQFDKDASALVAKLNKGV